MGRNGLSVAWVQLMRFLKSEVDLHVVLPSGHCNLLAVENSIIDLMLL